MVVHKVTYAVITTPTHIHIEETFTNRRRLQLGIDWADEQSDDL